MRSEHHEQQAQQLGLCECGCGGKAPIARWSNATRGYVKGQPMRWIKGHAGTKQWRPQRMQVEGVACLAVPLTQGLVALIDEADEPIVRDIGWVAFVTRSGTKYAKARLRGVGRHQFMHRRIMSAPDGFEVDHINGNGLDNRRSNLRICTPQENQRNKRKRPGTSRFKGVTRNRSQKWTAQISVGGGRTINLGSFEREEDAAAAYDRAALKHYGAFAHLNGVTP